MANLKISQLTELNESDGTEYTEVIIPPFTPGTNRKILTSKIGISRELDRTYTPDLLFNKNEIEGVIHTQTAAINFTVADGGHLDDQWSVYGQRVVADGVNPFTFTGFNHISGISNGDVLEAGTYQFIFWYGNGVARVSLMVPSQEAANLVALSTPANFTAIPGGTPETEVDLEWDAVANASSYHIDFGSSSSGPWTSLTDPIAAATTYTHTGLTEGTPYFYRIRAIGDGVLYNNSNYAAANTTTEDAGDTDAPTFIFSPADAATDMAVNQVVTITASEALKLVGGAEVTNGSLSGILTVKVDDGAGANIDYIATIDASKTIITITPDIIWPPLDNVFIEIDGVEDVNGNASTADSATIATSDFTIMTNNYLNFGETFDTLIAADDTNFDFLVTAKDLFVAGDVNIFRKYESGARSIQLRFYNGNAIIKVYEPIVPDHTADDRQITWTGAVNDDNEHDYELRYRGAIDTNNGLDRFALYKDGVLQGSKSLIAAGGHPWPWPLRDNGSPLKIGPTYAQVKDVIIKSALGTVTELNVPIIRTGLDVSGNARHGTWV